MLGILLIAIIPRILIIVIFLLEVLRVSEDPWIVNITVSVVSIICTPFLLILVKDLYIDNNAVVCFREGVLLVDCQLGLVGGGLTLSILSAPKHSLSSDSSIWFSYRYKARS